MEGWVHRGRIIDEWNWRWSVSEGMWLYVVVLYVGRQVFITTLVGPWFVCLFVRNR